VAESRTFRIRFEKLNRITFSDNLHEMTIRRRNDSVREHTVSQLSRGLGDGTLIDPDTVRLLGLNLYELLFFNAHANEWFERVYESSSDLRLVLEFQTQDLSLMGYPWEFLFVPEKRWKQGGKYLLTQGRLSLVRRIVRRLSDPRPVERPRFLVVDCLPVPPESVQAGYRAASEAGRHSLAAPTPEIDQLMAFLEAAGDVHCLRFPTFVELMDEVSAYEPDVVHLTGHGRFQAGDDAGFEFCLRPRADGELERWEKDERIAEAIGACVPELVVLHSCKGGKTDRYERYEGAAVRLVKRGVANVVALQHEIPLRDATRFVNEFYTALAQKRNVETAIKEGRQALRRTGVASFGLPVAYVQRAESFALPQPPAPSDATDRRRAAPAGGREARPERTDGGVPSDEPLAAPEPEGTRSLGSAIPGRPATPLPGESAPAQRGPAGNPLSVRFGRGEP
jgi:hypothetical protein